MKRLIIHIGTGKTGTTAIQDYFFNNKSSLAAVGVNYCDSGLVSNNHHNLCRNYLRQDSEAASVITKCLIELESEIVNSSHHTHIISSEYFPGLEEEEILEIRDRLSSLCNIEVVLYLRRQDHFLESWYSQLVKAYPQQFNIIDLQKNLETANIFDYEKLVRNWDVFNNKFHVNSYEIESFYEHNLILDFLQKISVEVDLTASPLSPVKSNLSLSVEQAQFKNSLNEIATPEQREILAKPIVNTFSSKKHYIDKENRVSIVSQFSKQNNYVAQNYLNRKSLFLDQDFPDEHFDGDFLNSPFTIAFILYLKYDAPELYSKIKNLLCFYFRNQYDLHTKLNDCDACMKSIFYASYLSPDGPNVASKYDKLKRW